MSDYNMFIIWWIIGYASSLLVIAKIWNRILFIDLIGAAAMAMLGIFIFVAYIMVKYRKLIDLVIWEGEPIDRNRTN